MHFLSLSGINSFVGSNRLSNIDHDPAKELVVI